MQLLFSEKYLRKENDTFPVFVNTNPGKSVIALNIFFMPRTVEPSPHHFFGT